MVTPKLHKCRRLDVRLSVCPLGCIKGKHVKWALAIETRRSFGSGRQALRILDMAFVQHGGRLAMSSTTELMALRCSDMAQLEEVLSTFDSLRLRIPNLTDTVSLELLRRLVKGVGKWITW